MHYQLELHLNKATYDPSDMEIILQNSNIIEYQKNNSEVHSFLEKRKEFIISHAPTDPRMERSSSYMWSQKLPDSDIIIYIYYDPCHEILDYHKVNLFITNEQTDIDLWENSDYVEEDEKIEILERYTEDGFYRKCELKSGRTFNIYIEHIGNDQLDNTSE